MAKQIRLSKNAKADFNKIAEYLSVEFGGKISEQFMSRFDEMCAVISDNPFIYQLHNKKRQVRKAVLKKQCTIYYKVDTENIEILRIFDTRQNPERLKKL